MQGVGDPVEGIRPLIERRESQSKIAHDLLRLIDKGLDMQSTLQSLDDLLERAYTTEESLKARTFPMSARLFAQTMQTRGNDGKGAGPAKDPSFVTSRDQYQNWYNLVRGDALRLSSLYERKRSPHVLNAIRVIASEYGIQVESGRIPWLPQEFSVRGTRGNVIDYLNAVG